MKKYIKYFFLFCFVFLLGSLVTVFRQRNTLLLKDRVNNPNDQTTISPAVNDFNRIINKLPPTVLISNYYNSLLTDLDRELASWDNNYLITEVKIIFSDTPGLAQKFYESGLNNLYGDVKVYSYKKRSERSYEINKDRLDLITEIDKKGLDSIQKSWPINKEYRSTGLDKAFGVCYEEGKTRGDFYVHDCSLKLGYKTTRQNTFWICHFVDKKEAESLEYLYEAKKSFNCFVNFETGKFSNWSPKTDASL